MALDSSAGCTADFRVRYARMPRYISIKSQYGLAIELITYHNNFTLSLQNRLSKIALSSGLAFLVDLPPFFFTTHTAFSTATFLFSFFSILMHSLNQR